MYEQLKRKDDIAVFRFVSKGETMSNQVQQREKGFRDYLHQQVFEGNIHTIVSLR